MKYIINDVPIPLQRARHSRYSVYDAQKIIRSHQEIELSHQVKIPRYEGVALRFTVIFYFAPPAKMPLKQKKALIGKAHIYRPDNSNVYKWIEDIAQGAQIYKDDCAISYSQMLKIYDWTPRTEFSVRPITDDEILKITHEMLKEINS